MASGNGSSINSLLKLVVISIYVLALAVGIAGSLSMLAYVWLFSTYRESGGIFLFTFFFMFPLAADLVYLIWVIRAVGVKTKRAGMFRWQAWLPILLALLGIVSTHYLLFIWVGSWGL